MKYKSMKKYLAATLALLMPFVDMTVFAAADPLAKLQPRLEIEYSYVDDDGKQIDDTKFYSFYGINEDRDHMHIVGDEVWYDVSFDQVFRDNYALKLESNEKKAHISESSLSWAEAKPLLPYGELEYKKFPDVDEDGIEYEYEQLIKKASGDSKPTNIYLKEMYHKKFGDVYYISKDDEANDLAAIGYPKGDGKPQIVMAELDKDDFIVKNSITPLNPIVTLTVPADNDVIWDYNAGNNEGEKSKFHLNYTLHNPETLNNPVNGPEGYKFQGWRVKKWDGKDWVTFKDLDANVEKTMTFNTNEFPSYVDDEEDKTKIKVEGVWSKDDDASATKYSITVEYAFNDEGKDKEKPAQLEEFITKATEFNNSNASKDKAKGDAVVLPESLPTINQEIPDTKNDGKWIFESFKTGDQNFDATNPGTVDKADINIVGTWNFTPNTYKVTLTYKVTGEDKENKPQELTDLLDPARETKIGEVEKGKDVEVPEIKQEIPDPENDGNWVFKGLTPENTVTEKVVEGNKINVVEVDTANVALVGTYEFEPNTYKLTYTYDVQATATLPENLMKELNTFNKVLTKDATETYPKPTNQSVNVVGGKLVFKGWHDPTIDNDPILLEKTFNLGKTNKEFVGVWELELNKNIDFGDWEGNDPDRPVPTDLINKFVENPKPIPTDGKTPGEKVKVPNPTLKGTDSTVPDTENDGSWSFKGWKKKNSDEDPNPNMEITVGGEDVDLVGVWDFTPNTHQVNFKFVSADKTPLPDDLKADKESEEGFKDAKVTTPKNTSEIKNEDGTWEFLGWKLKDSQEEANKELTEVTIGTEDANYEGVWKFTPKEVTPEVLVEKHTVNFEFVSGTKGVELPQEVKDKTPAAVTKEKGKTVELKDFSNQTVETNDGTWTFKSWDKSGPITVEDYDVTVRGSWTFTPKEVTPEPKPEPEIPVKEQKVKYQFVNKTGQTLPEILNKALPKEETVNKNETVKPKKPTVEELLTATGKWTFDGWDKNVAVIGDEDVTFSGTWTFTEMPLEVLKTGTVKFSFVSKVDGQKLPKEVMDLLPTDITGFPVGTPVNATDLTDIQIKVLGGTWKFTGWKQKTTKVEEGEPKTLTAIWEYVADEKSPETKPKPETIEPGDPKEPTNPVKPTKVTSTAKVEVSSSQTVAQPVVKPIPRTSDESHIMMYVMLVMSGLMGVAVSVKRLLVK